jgi:hypothetical protein
LTSLLFGLCVGREQLQSKQKSDWQDELSVFLVVDAVFMRGRFALLLRVPPLVVLLTGFIIALHGGYATPSEMAGLGAVLALDTRV